MTVTMLADNATDLGYKLPCLITSYTYDAIASHIVSRMVPSLTILTILPSKCPFFSVYMSTCLLSCLLVCMHTCLTNKTAVLWRDNKTTLMPACSASLTAPCLPLARRQLAAKDFRSKHHLLLLCIDPQLAYQLASKLACLFLCFHPNKQTSKQANKPASKRHPLLAG
jgi:hypothetical protein